MPHPLEGANRKGYRKPGYVPGRYHRRKGHTNQDIAQKREELNRAEGKPVEAKPFTNLEIPSGDFTPGVIDWCEPLDPAFRVR